MNNPHRCAGLLLTLYSLLLLACKNDAPSKTPGSHERMIAILDSINRNADAMRYLNLNHRKAAFLQEQLKTADGNNLLNIKFACAVELLKAGQNEASAVQLKEMIQMTGDQLTPQSKILYEMLAMTYMRMGEQANCIDTHTHESCVLPIAGSGIYKMTSGPENALKVYERILGSFPDDLQSRWLYNLAYMALGKWPDAVPRAHLWPTSTFKLREGFRFENIAIPLGLDVDGISGGVCLEDFDNDGNIDVFVTSYGLDHQVRYFRNNGDGTFAERTQEANLTGIVSGLNTIQADYDNDGDRDILILRGAWLMRGTHPNSLLRNNGDGTFTDVTIDAGLLSFHPTQAADWADYDGDGWLDLFIGNETYNEMEPHRCELYHNNGDGTFTNVAPQLGIDYFGFFKAVVWGDINNDQRPDLYVSNLVGDNLLLVNRGGASPDNWRFEDIAPQTGTLNPQTSFPAFFFDYDNDGFDDIFCSSFPPNYEDPTVTPLLQEYLGKQPAGDWLRIYRNNGNETFTDVTRELGMQTITFAMGNNFGDFDNDGWLDIYLGTGKPDFRSLIPNRVFHNRNGKRFEDISMNGFSHIQKGHGLAVADIDNDGDQDIYVVAGGAFEGDRGRNILYENPGNNNRWLTLILEGKTSNRDAMGAKIKVRVRQKNGVTRDIFVTVGTGGSFGASSLRQEIGLGDAAEIVSVEVRWPKAGVPNTLYKDIALDTVVKLKEGNDQAEAVMLKSIPLRRNQAFGAAK